MRRWWANLTTYLLLGLIALAGSVVVLNMSLDKMLSDEAWRSGMVFAGYIEKELPDLDSIFESNSNRSAVESELGGLTLVGNIFRFEFRNPAGELVFETGAFHPGTGTAPAEHHAHLHADAAAAPARENAYTVANAPLKPSIHQTVNVLTANVAPRSEHHLDNLSDDEGGMAVHSLQIIAGDGIRFPGTYALITHPVSDAAGTLKGTISLFLDLSGRAALLNTVVIGAACAILSLFLLGAAGPALSFVASQRDRKLADHKIRYMAAHDGLTGLMNRASFVAFLENLVAGGKGKFAVHFFDIDNFKQLNDTFGHDLGDAVLKSVANRLRAIAGHDLAIARLGGDEFAIVQNRINSGEEAEELAAAVVALLRKPIETTGPTVISTVSLGTALAPEDGNSVSGLMKSADMAMYYAKAAGRDSHCRFGAWMDEKQVARRGIESRLRWALANNGFEVHYQPLFAAKSRKLLGFEALLRLSHADGSSIGPDEFIPVAEEMRLIEDIGLWILNRACKFAAGWPEKLALSVNLSIGQFFSGNLVSQVEQALWSTGLEASRLELEVTESLLVQDSKRTLDQLLALKALGVSIAMDDFGTGYSSLGSLREFPFDRIKIDRSFLRDFHDQSSHITSLVQAIVGLAEAMMMDTTAEGVETEQQLLMLEAAGCDRIQGFLLGKPASEAETIRRILAPEAPVNPAPELAAESPERSSRKTA